MSWDAWRETVQTCFVPPCRPPVWARGGHAQTLIAHMWPSPYPSQQSHPLHVTLADGDRLHMHWYQGRRKALLMLFHGLGGSAQSDYMRRTTRIGLAQGFHVLAVNHRGCGEGAGLAAKPYHSGSAEDMAAVSAFLRERFPDHLQVAIGFSLSGNVLLLLLLQANIRGQHQPDLGIAVNAPIDLEHSAHRLHSGLARLYNWRFAHRCKQDLHKRRKAGLVDTLPDFPLLLNLNELDDLYTAPVCGFADRHDYHRTCSSRQHLGRIQRPTVMFTAQNDPMVEVRDYEQAPNQGPLYVHVEDCGGHMGYIQAAKHGRFWLDGTLERLLHRLVPEGEDRVSSLPREGDRQ